MRIAANLSPRSRRFLVRNGSNWFGLSRIYEYQGRLDLALQNLDEGIRLDPLNKQLYVNAFRIAAEVGQRELANQYLQRWLVQEPNDREVRAVMQNIDSILEQEYNIGPSRQTPPEEGEE